MKYCLGFLLFSLFLCTLAFTQEKIIVAASDSWPPYVDQKNPTDGISLEIIRAALSDQGYTVKMTYVPWARADEGVRNGTYDILPDAWMVESRKSALAYSNPYATNEVKFIKLKGDPFEFTDLESLKGKRIGVVKDYGYGDEFSQSPLFTRDEVSDLITNIKKLIIGHIDLTLDDPIVALYEINAIEPALISQIQFTKKALSSNDLYICVGLKNPREKEIISAFNTGLAKIKANGKFKQIFEKYGIKELE